MAEKKKKRSDGYYTVSFRMNGKRYYSYGKTQKEANQKAEEKKKEIASKAFTKNADEKFSKYFECWIDLKTGSVKEVTIYSYKCIYTNIANIAIDEKGNSIADIKLKDIEPQHIKTIQKTLACNNSTSTVNQKISLLRSVFGNAVKERIITWNPCDTVKDLKKTEPKAVETIHRALTREETKAFFASAENVNSWYLNLYKFLLLTGCRIGEASALKYNDIDYKQNVIHIRRTLTKSESGGLCIGDTTKSRDGVRDIPITQKIKNVLESQKELKRLVGFSLRMDGLIFVSPKNNMVTLEGVSYDLRKICKLANIKKFSAHAFRDTFATRAIECGMNPKTLQKILGHSKINITMEIYTHVMEDTKEKEMQLIDVAL